MSRFLSLLLVLCLAAPAWAQPDRSSYVSAVAAARGDLLARNDHESVARFTQCVLAALPEAWDFLSKSAAENGYTWPNGVRTSHDVIVHRATGRQVDVVANSAATDGTPGRATWIPIDPAVYRPSNRPVAPAGVPTALCAVPARPAESAAPAHGDTDSGQYTWEGQDPSQGANVELHRRKYAPPSSSIS